MRDLIISRIRDTFENDTNTLAFWQAGSAAFGRCDEFSDLDLQLLVSDDYLGTAIEKLERTLLDIAPFEVRFELPQPTSHGFWQCFYRLANAPKFLFIDVVILKESATDLFTQEEIHGKQVIFFDRTSRIGNEKVAADFIENNRKKRLYMLEGYVQVFATFVEKELLRHRNTDAIHCYFNALLRPLIESLRLLYDPFRFDFGGRYLQYCLPPEEYKRLEVLHFVASPEDLTEKSREAYSWLVENVERLRQLS